LEILDLSLYVVRQFFVPLAQALFMGVIPLVIFNYVLIGWMTNSIFEMDDIYELPLRYIYCYTVLAFIEAPLATVLVTAYLGQAVFLERPSLRNVTIGVLRLTPRLIWSQLIVRGVALAWLFAWATNSEGEENAFEVLLFILACGVGLLRALRPFMNEIVLLERNPVFSRDSRTMTIGKRSSLLHGAVGGDLFLQWMASAFVACSLFVAFGSAIYMIVATFTNDNRWGPVLSHVGVPLTVWLVAGFITVVRFLNYLDSRIRQEGWEVELRVRAEATRLAHRLV
jgi:hypothetical protein